MSAKIKFLDLPKLIKRVWLILWAILLILLVMKYCFGVWYPIVVENERFIRFCDYVDENKIIKYSINFVSYTLTSNLIFLTLTKRKKYSKVLYGIIANILFVIAFFLKFLNNIFGIIFELGLIVVSIVYNLKNKQYHRKISNIIIPLIIYILLNVWQLNIYLVRGINNEIISNLSTVLMLALQVDYYIFLIITFIGVCFMGLMSWGWLWSKEVTELEALKAEELAKKEPDQKFINEIDKVIAEKSR